MTGVGRLAPTPSGALHLGNALAFAAAWLSARQQGLHLVLRVEDVDATRARDSLTDGIRQDLGWLGLTVDAEVPPQSARTYDAAIAALADRAYRCTCSRAMWAVHGRYPGTCRDAGHPAGALRLRLDPGPVSFADAVHGPCAIDAFTRFGDPVLVRRDGVVAYPLAVVADDIADSVTEVVRGADLLEHTAVQLALYDALDAPAPRWVHAPMLVDAQGRKLGKSHGSTAVAALRDAGWSAGDVWAWVLPHLGIPGVRALPDALGAFDTTRLPRGPIPVREPDATR